MVDLFIFLLVFSGLTQILTRGKIFNKIRPNFEFFYCSQCIGFWVGLIMYLVFPITGLWSFTPGILNAIFMGLAISLTSMFSDYFFR